MLITDYDKERKLTQSDEEVGRKSGDTVTEIKMEIHWSLMETVMKKAMLVETTGLL